VPTLTPVFTLSIGSYRATAEAAVGGPRQIIVERDMAIAADLLEVDLMQRSGIALGDAATLELGHDDRQGVVFTGDVVELHATLTGVCVRALGKLNALLQLHVTATYEGQSVGSIVEDLVRQAGLTAGTIEAGPTLPRYAIDRRLSGYRHARDLADRLGFELYTDRAGRAMFRALGAAAALDQGGGLLGAAAGAAASALGLDGAEGYAFGRHLIAATARHRVPALGTVQVGGESPMSSAGDTSAHWLTTNSEDYRGVAGDGEPVRLIFDAAARTKDLADRFAAGYLVVNSRGQQQVNATVLGRPSLELGDAVSLSAAPEGLVNGSGYVRAIRHRVGVALGFLTDVRVVLEASP
jgi:hypothetical protein